MKRTDLYTQEEIDLIKFYYPTFHNQDLAAMLNRSVNGMTAKANELGMCKHKAYVRYNMRRVSEIGRQIKPERSSHFKKGHPSWNKGRKVEGEWLEKMKLTSFQKGNVPYNLKEIGHIRNYKGYNEIKIGHKQWISCARHTWMQIHGEIPKGYVVFRIDGDMTNDDISNLCLVHRADLAVQNRWIKPLPQELQEIQRMIFNIKKLTNEKQNKRFTKSSV